MRRNDYNAVASPNQNSGNSMQTLCFYTIIIAKQQAGLPGHQAL
jgi:hypothetical protein